MVEYISMTWQYFHMINLITGLVCVAAGMIIGELKYNRENFINRIRGVLNGLAG